MSLRVFALVLLITVEDGSPTLFVFVKSWTDTRCNVFYFNIIPFVQYRVIHVRITPRQNHPMPRCCCNG